MGAALCAVERVWVQEMNGLACRIRAEFLVGQGLSWSLSFFQSQFFSLQPLVFQCHVSGHGLSNFL